MRQHAPLGPVDRLTEFRDHVVIGPLLRGGGVGKGAVADRQRVIGFELFRVADFRRELRELVARFHLGAVAHPGQLIQVGRHRLAQVHDELVHLGLVFGREVALGIDLADALTDRAFDGRYGAAPAGALFFRACQGRAVERKHGVIDPLRQHIGICAQVIGREPGAPGFDRRCVHHLEDAFNAAAGNLGGIFCRNSVLCNFFRGRRHLTHNELSLLADTKTFKHRLDREAAAERDDILLGHLVIGQIAVAPDGAVPVCFRDIGFERDDSVGSRSRVFESGLRQQRREHRLVGGAQFEVLLTVDEIVVAVAHAETGLVHVEDVGIGIGGIDIHEAAERGGHAIGRKQRGQVFTRRCCLDLLEHRTSGLEACGFDRVRVHVGVVDRRDLGFDRAFRRRRSSEFFDDLANALLGLLAQKIEGAVTRAVSRNLEVLDPVTVGIGVEVISGVYGCVLGRKVDAPAAPFVLC